MILIAGAAVGVAVLALTGARISKIATLPMRALPLVWLAIGLQAVTYPLSSHVADWLSSVLHVATYAIAGAFVWLNRRLPGLWIIAAGGAMNLIAIAANGGVMPASRRAWRIAGFDEERTRFENSFPVEHPRLGLLGDIFAVPHGWPFANVFSFGDVVLVVGLVVMVDRWCRIGADRSAAVATASQSG